MRDVDIRRALRTRVRDSDDMKEALVVDELGLCQGRARIDLAVVNSSLHGYEIKSERDTLARLPSQSDAYGCALEFVTIVVAAHHALKAYDLVPGWWGIWSVAPGADGRVEFNEVREPMPNPSLDPYAVAAFLWREKVLEELENRGLANGFRSKPRRALWMKLAEALSTEERSSLNFPVKSPYGSPRSVKLLIPPTCLAGEARCEAPRLS